MWTEKVAESLLSVTTKEKNSVLLGQGIQHRPLDKAFCEYQPE